MNKQGLLIAFKDKIGLTKPEAKAAVNLFFNKMSNALANGDRVKIRGLCSFYVKKYKVYTGRNPKTGEQVKIKPKKENYMQEGNYKSALILGVCILLGLAFLGVFLGSSAIKFKEYERTVTVKGLSEKEYPADVALWPIHFSSANNDLAKLYASIEKDSNKIKPIMVEEATTKAREVAEKFAKDSNSKLGKIKKARQGQSSINNRDKNNPHIKKIRVVSTVEYYLSD